VDDEEENLFPNPYLSPPANFRGFFECVPNKLAARLVHCYEISSNKLQVMMPKFKELCRSAAVFQNVQQIREHLLAKVKKKEVEMAAKNPGASAAVAAATAATAGVGSGRATPLSPENRMNDDRHTAKETLATVTHELDDKF
jgi:hypothetical protein